MKIQVLLILNLVILTLSNKCIKNDSMNSCEMHKTCTWDHEQSICITKCKHITNIDNCKNILYSGQNHGFLSKFYETKCVKEGDKCRKEIFCDSFTVESSCNNLALCVWGGERCLPNCSSINDYSLCKKQFGDFCNIKNGICFIKNCSLYTSEDSCNEDPQCTFNMGPCETKRNCSTLNQDDCNTNSPRCFWDSEGTTCEKYVPPPPCAGRGSLIDCGKYDETCEWNGALCLDKCSNFENNEQGCAANFPRCIWIEERKSCRIKLASL